VATDTFYGPYHITDNNITPIRTNCGIWLTNGFAVFRPPYRFLAVQVCTDCQRLDGPVY
jgi:hypothetical protein